MKTDIIVPWVYPCLRACLYALALGLLMLIPLHDTQPIAAQAEYDSALQLFRSGSLEKSQQQAEQGYRQFRERDPDLAARFQLLEAEDLLWRGMYEDALRVLSGQSPNHSSPEATIG